MTTTNKAETYAPVWHEGDGIAEARRIVDVYITAGTAIGKNIRSLDHKVKATMAARVAEEAKLADVLYQAYASEALRAVRADTGETMGATFAQVYQPIFAAMGHNSEDASYALKLRQYGELRAERWPVTTLGAARGAWQARERTRKQLAEKGESKSPAKLRDHVVREAKRIAQDNGEQVTGPGLMARQYGAVGRPPKAETAQGGTAQDADPGTVADALRALCATKDVGDVTEFTQAHFRTIAAKLGEFRDALGTNQAPQFAKAFRGFTGSPAKLTKANKSTKANKTA